MNHVLNTLCGLAVTSTNRASNERAEVGGENNKVRGTSCSLIKSADMHAHWWVASGKGCGLSAGSSGLVGRQRAWLRCELAFFLGACHGRANAAR
jgi:hypothetical protein